MEKHFEKATAPARPGRRLPRTFKELTPSNHFNPRTANLGKLFPRRMESDFDAQQALGGAQVARSTPRLRRLRGRTPGPPDLSRRRQRVFRWVQRNRPAPGAGNRLAADWRLLPGL